MRIINELNRIKVIETHMVKFDKDRNDLVS